MSTEFSGIIQLSIMLLSPEGITLVFLLALVGTAVNLV
jgi:hypothetical protein